MAERVAERTERHAPQLVAVGPVGEKAEIGEECVDVPAVGGWSRGHRAVGRPLDFLYAGPGRFAPPQDSSRRALERYGEKLIPLDGGQKDPVAGDRRGRMAGWQGRLPDNTLIGPELQGKLRFIGYAGSVRTAE